MDEVDKANLVQIIVEHVYKYDAEGRRIPLTAEDVVTYATTLSDYIEGE